MGIPVEGISARLKVNRKTAKKYSENRRLIQSVKKSLKKGQACHKVAEKQGCPEPLVWSLALEGKSDLDRFKALNWGLRTWDLWSWNDCLPREIHVNDSEAYFTGVTNVSETIGPVASRPK
jgi:hypothetical protein